MGRREKMGRKNVMKIKKKVFVECGCTWMKTERPVPQDHRIKIGREKMWLKKMVETTRLSDHYNALRS